MTTSQRKVFNHSTGLETALSERRRETLQYNTPTAYLEGSFIPHGAYGVSRSRSRCKPKRCGFSTRFPFNIKKILKGNLVLKPQRLGLHRERERDTP
jgi:hypothetical protein